ncbi:MAG: VTT domain-containing protein [Planctomycetota bacterium]|nr:VTT domain-containing protein [Planctomycetota bacterium]
MVIVCTLNSKEKHFARTYLFLQGRIVKVIHQRILALVGLVFAIATLGIVTQHYATLDWLITEETYVRNAVESSPLQCWLISFAIYLCLSLIPGTAGKSVVAGWLFGFWAAVLMVDLALTLAALITFFVSRFIFRESIEARFGISLVRFRSKLESQAGFYLLSLRLLHTPFSFLNYAAGATSIVPVRTFWWTTQLGLLPSTMIFVCAGSRVPALSVVAEKGPIALLDGPLIAALLATSMLPFLLRAITAVVQRVYGKGYNSRGSR